MPGDFFAHFAELNANGSLFFAYPQRSYGCALGPFPCQSQKALGHCTNSFNQRLPKKQHRK